MRKGVTLIELLIVVVIVGMLAAFALGAINGSPDQRFGGYKSLRAQQEACNAAGRIMVSQPYGYTCAPAGTVIVNPK